MGETWRDIARPLIHQVLEENKGKSEKEIKAALREAYPFGMRKYHPYKIWCDEIKVQRKQKTFGGKKPVNNPDQINLFE